MDAIADFINNLDALVWGLPMLILLLGSHLFLTFRTGFIQRKIGTAIKLSVTRDPNAPGDISQFGALCTALSATIGTGNIVGVGTAIMAGGPGAVLWMWLTGVFGIATKYSETYASVKYRVKDHSDRMLGGAMYAWRRGFVRKNGSIPWWALLGAAAFALFAAIASFGIGSATQSNAMTEVITTSTGNAIPSWVIGLVIVVLVGLVIFGGVTVISRVCEKLVPFMAIAYAVGCVVIICMNAPYVIPAIGLIVECAFTPHAAFGGLVGSGVMLALQYGCARGLFSNESGLGSAPIVAAAASTRNPARQALVSMTGTFWDTVVICALTGIVLVSTMIANPGILISPEAIAVNSDPEFYAALMAHPELVNLLETGAWSSATSGIHSWDATLTNSELITVIAAIQDVSAQTGTTILNGSGLTSAAFAMIPYIGQPILVIGMFLFAYSTILGWSYYGNRCVTYLFGKNAIMPYQIIYLIVAFLGSIGVGTLVWSISDITNALMAVPNIIVVLLLSGVIARETKHYVYENHLDEVDDTPIPRVDTK